MTCSLKAKEVVMGGTVRLDDGSEWTRRSRLDFEFHSLQTPPEDGIPFTSDNGDGNARWIVLRGDAELQFRADDEQPKKYPY